MNNPNLKYLPQQLGKSPSFKEAKIFHIKDGSWLDIESGNMIDSELAEALCKNKIDKDVVKLPTFKKIAFFLDNRELMVVASLPPKTRVSTIEKHYGRLKEHLSSAKSSYNAQHDELTGVLNRHGIKSLIEQAYYSTGSDVAESDEADQQSSEKANIALFAFDIDRFKQVNDTFGHEAGDSVLRSFALRLNTLAEKLNDSYSATFIFGRPGGEEFELVCVGAVSRQERTEIGDLLLHEIRKPMVYKNTPVKGSKKDDGHFADISRLPSQVTASIGLAWTRGAEAANANSILSDLRKEADAALYRAKADGRNCLRAYEDIRRFHGRVLEYFGDAELIQIDIGAKVGVKIGHVFSVFYTPFTGTEKMKRNDSGGKILGDYPKLPSATVQVISADNEVATATVIHQLSHGAIPVGSLLKYLPTGSKIFPHSRCLSTTAVTEPLSKLYAYLEVLDTANLPYCLFTMRWNVAGESRAKKEQYTEFFTLLRFHLPSKSRIFYSSGNPVFVCIPDFDVDDKDDVEKLLSDIAKLLRDSNFEISVGATHSNLLPDAASKIPEALAFYAATALKSSKKNMSKVVVFDVATPHSTMEIWRDEGKSDEALVDYHNFRLYGFDSPSLDNQFGLAIIRTEATEHFALAEAAFSRAAFARKTNNVISANLALLQTLRGKYREALENFEKSKAFVTGRKGVYGLAFAKAKYEISKIDSSASKADLSSLLVEAIESFSKPPRPPYDRLWMDVKNALKKGGFD